MGLLQPHDKTHSWYDGEAKNDFRSMTGDFIYRHHVEPRVKLYVPTEESCPIPLKYIDVTRNTHTSLDVMLEKNFNDYWNRLLLDTCIKLVRFDTFHPFLHKHTMVFAQKLTDFYWILLNLFFDTLHQKQ